MLSRSQRINTFMEQIQEANKTGAIGLFARVLVQATLPHSKLLEPNGEKEKLDFTRRNGRLSLTVVGHRDVGLPYGSYPRLLLSWITSEAKRTNNRELVLGDSLNEFMKKLGIIPSRGRWGTVPRLQDQMQRLFACTISYIREDDSNWSVENTPIVRRANLWWNPKAPKQICEMNSSVVLDEEFFNEVLHNPVPYKIDTLKALKQSSMAVDIYLWVTYRNSYANKPFWIKWEDLQLQFGAQYPSNVRGKLDFKKNFLEALRKVAYAYPEAIKLRPETNYLIFVPGRPDVSKRILIPTNLG